MHCAGQHKPYAEWHKPCRYYRLLFRNLQAPLPISTAVFCCFRPSSPQSYGTFHRWFPPPFSVDRNAIGPFAVVFSVGRSQPPSPSPDWDFRRFPLCGPLSRTAAEIFTGSLGATRVLWKLPRREAAPLLGRLCFLSVIDGVAPYQNLISNETAWIKAVSLVFLRSIAWHRAAAPVVCGSD